MLNIEDSILIVVDVQGKLASLMYEHESLFFNLERMIKAIQVLEVPILWTEQAPEKIGQTIPSISALLSPKLKPITKRSFSCWGAPEFAQALRSSSRKQVIIVGIETHVCIYQTCRDLFQAGFEVFLVADATSARGKINRDVTLSRIRQEGMTITTAEEVVCELLKSADHPKFKEVMAYIKREKGVA